MRTVSQYEEIRWFPDFERAMAYRDFVAAQGITSARVETMVIGRSHSVQAYRADIERVYRTPAFFETERAWLWDQPLPTIGKRRDGDDLDEMLGR